MIVGAPTAHRRVGEPTAAKCVACAHRQRRPDAGDRHWRRPGGCRAITELPRAVVTPALQPVVRQPGAGVAISDADGAGCRDADDRDGGGAVGGRAVTEPAKGIVTPAP